MKKCNKVPVSTSRKVPKTVCKTVVDITTIEDCEEVIITKCSQTQQSVAHASNVVGKKIFLHLCQENISLLILQDTTPE